MTIAERGRHAELVALDGLYALMWRRQQEALEMADGPGALEMMIEAP